MAGLVIGVLCLLMWMVVVPSMTSPGGGDAAGTAIANAFAVMFLVAFWCLLGVLGTVTAVTRGMPWPAAIAALVLIPASGVVAIRAQELLFKPGLPPHHWPLIIPAVAPLLIMLFCLWALIPAVRAAIPATVAGGVAWGGILVLCFAIGPLEGMRAQALDELAAERQKFDDAFAAIPPDAPLWAWLPFLNSNDQSKISDALAKISHSNRRQADAEIMLDRGDFPLRLIGVMDLEPTPTLCDKARALLRQQAARLVANEQPPNTVRDQASDAVNALRWLVGYDCPCDAEIQAWQDIAEAHPEVGYSKYELRDLRDPKWLGRTLRESPARFSMLSPKSHLKAWLKFADDKAYREQALTGARALDHRTTDAVAMLTDQNDPWVASTVLRYLPFLDLEATKPLCDAALPHIHEEFARIYRPKPDDPRTYNELLDRLSRYDPLRALRWLAAHGCEANATLDEAMELIRAYGDSPARAAMLASLERLKR